MQFKYTQSFKVPYCTPACKVVHNFT